MEPSVDPISSDEMIYRRVPVSTGWYEPGNLSAEAFGPTKNDTTGISVSRANCKSIEEAANGPSKKGYYVAELRVKDLFDRNIAVEPKPLPGDPGHAEIPDVNYTNRKESATIEMMATLAELVCQVHGPFHHSSLA